MIRYIAFLAAIGSCLYISNPGYAQDGSQQFNRCEREPVLNAASPMELRFARLRFFKELPDNGAESPTIARSYILHLIPGQLGHDIFNQFPQKSNVKVWKQGDMIIFKEHTKFFPSNNQLQVAQTDVVNVIHAAYVLEFKDY